MQAIVYACSHRNWISETIRSAKSCRAHMPDLPRLLYVTPELAKDGSLTPHFSQVNTVNQLAHSHRPKFESMLTAQTGRALFIDSDTFFASPANEMFDVLDHFDIALATAPQYLNTRALRSRIYDLLPHVSPALPEWNGGVIVARVNDRFREFVRRWIDMLNICAQHGYTMDQAALRAALVTSDLRIATLPVNYNFRANMRQTIKGRVKILHAHGDLPKIAGYINDSLKARHYTPKQDEIEGFAPRRE